MKKKILLPLIIFALLLPISFARFEWSSIGYHDVLNETITAYLVDYELTFVQDEDLSAWDMSDESIMKVKYEVPQIEANINEITIWCSHYYYISTQEGKETKDTFLVFNSSNTPKTDYLTYKLKANEELNCSVRTYWNTTHYQNASGSGTISQDYNVVGFYFLLPQWRSNFCYEYKIEHWNQEMEYVKLQKGYISQILTFVMNFLIMNFEMWVALYWIIKILIILFGVSIPLYFLIKLIIKIRESIKR